MLHVAQERKNNNQYKFLFQYFENIFFGVCGHKWKNNIKLILKTKR
jgi:hypothetical protein